MCWKRKPLIELNSDGRVDIADRLLWIGDPETGNTFLGDANFDGQFDSSDLVIVFTASEYEDETSSNSTQSTCGWNGDGDFNTSYIVLAFTVDGYDQGKRPVQAALLEPCTFEIMLLGLIGVRNKRVNPRHSILQSAD